MTTAFQAACFFLPEQKIHHLEPFGTGNINDTFLVTQPHGKQLVLQRVNPDVFPEPQAVLDNMRMVTAHLNHEIQNSPERKDRFIPLVLFCGEKGDSYQAEDGAVWRLLNRIPGKTCETVTKPSQAEELGRCLGIFHRLLSPLDPAGLAETLPGFHRTPAYLDHYDQVRIKHEQDNAPDLQLCHQFIEDRRCLATLLDDTPELSSYIIHGDPKVANFVFDDEGGRVVSLIDLDTVRPGLLLHDIGDALRSCCNPMGEMPSEPEQIHFAPDLFAAWLKGYFDEAGLLLTKVDKEHIVQATRMIAFELGLRFITDHLEGDRYFKASFPGHNLVRARVQFHLVHSIEDQMDELHNIINNSNLLSGLHCSWPSIII